MVERLPLLLLVACAKTVAPEAVKPAPTKGLDLSFEGVSLAKTEAEKRVIRVAPRFSLDGASGELEFHAIARSGEAIAGTTFGQIVDAKGDPMALPCSSPDYSGLLEAHGKLFALTHVECIPSAIYITELNADDQGLLSATSTQAVPMGAVGGGINHCAGSITPWGTLLSSEEYEFDAAQIQDDGSLEPDNWGYANLATYLGVPLPDVHVYDYGWMPEVNVVSGSGDAEVVKHFAMGRFSHEQGIVMPDGRTVYLADDGTNVGFFMFVADGVGDLSAGTLYAMKWNQFSSVERNGAEIEWISLGHATDAQIQARLSSKDLTFDDLFEHADPVDGVCPSELSSIRTYAGHECLAVREGMDLLASRVETRRYAALQGATTELTKGEGLTFDEARSRVYYALSSISRGMEAGADADVGGPDHVQLAPNGCGAVYGFDVRAGETDAAGKTIASDWVAWQTEQAVAGLPRTYEESSLSRNSCDVDRIANPDNLAFLPGSDILVVAEDTPFHENQVLWGVNVVTGAHERLLSAPWGGELTGLGWYPDVQGFGYLLVTIQHPFDDRFVPEGVDISSEDARSVVGYLGPFPSLAR